ncbi:5789_t:CDS:1, partial [Funneliformis geosporum]
ENAVPKSFLNKIGLDIDSTPDRILIGISGKITMPLSRINTFKHKIYTEEELPISQRAY